MQHELHSAQEAAERAEENAITMAAAAAASASAAAEEDAKALADALAESEAKLKAAEEKIAAAEAAEAEEPVRLFARPAMLDAEGGEANGAHEEEDEEQMRQLLAEKRRKAKLRKAADAARQHQLERHESFVNGSGEAPAEKPWGGEGSVVGVRVDRNGSNGAPPPLDLSAYDTATPLVAASNGFRAPPARAVQHLQHDSGSESGEGTEIAEGKALTPSDDPQSPVAGPAVVLAMD